MTASATPPPSQAQKQQQKKRARGRAKLGSQADSDDEGAVQGLTEEERAAKRQKQREEKAQKAAAEVRCCSVVDRHGALVLHRLCSVSARYLASVSATCMAMWTLQLGLLMNNHLDSFSSRLCNAAT